MTDALLAVLHREPLNVEPSPTWTWSLESPRWTTCRRSAVARRVKRRQWSQHDRAALVRYNVTVWYKCWSHPSFAAIRPSPPHAFAHFQHILACCVCCQDAAAELELSCDLFRERGSWKLLSTRWIAAVWSTWRTGGPDSSGLVLHGSLSFKMWHVCWVR